MNIQHRFQLTHPDDMSHFILVQYIKSKRPTLWDRIAEAH